MNDMTSYGKVRSTVKPEPKVIDDFSVWINTDIHEVPVNYEGISSIEYEYTQVQYSKEEYIQMIDNKNAELEQSVTDVQLALCEVYEML